MNLTAAGREYARLDITVDVEPTGTIELRIDDTWHPMEWTAAAVQSGTTWTRTARLLVAGPDADPGTAVVLTVGRHRTAWRLTDDPELIVREAATIDIR